MNPEVTGESVSATEGSKTMKAPIGGWVFICDSLWLNLVHLLESKLWATCDSDLPGEKNATKAI